MGRGGEGVGGSRGEIENEEKEEEEKEEEEDDIQEGNLRIGKRGMRVLLVNRDFIWQYLK